MNERIAYFVFSIALTSALTVAVGKQLVADYGRKVVPGLCAAALATGLLIGWAINGFIAYVRLWQTMRL
jgi:hypothetical protein